MRCLSNIKALYLKMIAGLLSCGIILSLSGCGRLDYSVSYETGLYPSSEIINMSSTGDKAEGFASDLCVLDDNLVGDTGIDISDCGSAVLFDLGKKQVVYYKDPYERLYPASITKIMTALVALKYGQMSDELVATRNVYVNEAGAQIIGLKEGDTMSLYQALNILLLYSANDVANMIAENIGGSIDGFVELMNAEAADLGATGTHFMNPNGLSDTEHYTTAYDLYLIFNECIKYSDFVSIISTDHYDTSYKNSSGNDVAVSINNTNGYLNGNYQSPANITVVGGKTGTTSAAGHCLILLSKDSSGNQYISVILKAETTDDLYNDMTSLLEGV